MKIAFYCQHVLGIGHFHRSLEICRALARENEVVMITGGPEVEVAEESFTFYQLPALEMDHKFQNLRPVDETSSLGEVKKEREKLLESFFVNFRPDTFLVELYPFGRKAFRFELDPILAKIREGKLPLCQRLCSLRDILVERQDKEKFENRVVSTFNTFFDGLLVHADESITPLEKTFSRTQDLLPPIYYTGYITPKPKTSARENLRQELHLSPPQKLVVASIGGGSVGEELLTASVNAFKLLPKENYYLQIFTGPYANPCLFENLTKLEEKNIRVSRFTHSFPDWLAAADLSISMAGYNTSMNLLAAGTPALVYPFAQNHEQQLRITNINQNGQFRILDKEDLQTNRLRMLIETQIEKKPGPSIINLDGATNTAKMVTLLQQDKGKVS